MSTSKASAKVAKDVEYVEYEMPAPLVGDSIAGEIFLTRHSCPGCSAEMETIGAGYPMYKCSRCNLPMIARSEKLIGDE